MAGSVLRLGYAKPRLSPNAGNTLTTMLISTKIGSHTGTTWIESKLQVLALTAISYTHHNLLNRLSCQTTNILVASDAKAGIACIVLVISGRLDWSTQMPSNHNDLLCNLRRFDRNHKKPVTLTSLLSHHNAPNPSEGYLRTTRFCTQSATAWRGGTQKQLPSIYRLCRVSSPAHAHTRAKIMWKVSLWRGRMHADARKAARPMTNNSNKKRDSENNP